MKQLYDLPALFQKISLQKSSKYFAKIREGIEAQLQKGFVEIAGQRLDLSPKFLELWYSPEMVKPASLDRLCRFLDLLKKFEALFLRVESLAPSSGKKEGLMSFFSFGLGGNVLFQGYGIQAEMHQLFEEILWFLEKDIIASVHEFNLETKLKETSLIDNLVLYLAGDSAGVSEIYPDFDKINWAKELGLILGHGVYFMNPENKSLSFIPQVLSHLPKALKALGSLVNSDDRRVLSYEYIVERAEQCIGSLNELIYNQSWLPLILNYHFIIQLREVVDLSQLFIKNLGFLKDDVQVKFKDKIALIKNDLLLPLYQSIEGLELELMLKPQALTGLFFSNIETSYNQMMLLSQKHIVYTPDEKQKLLKLYDAHWYECRLQANLLKQAKLHLEIDNFCLQDRYFTNRDNLDLSDLQMRLQILAPYVQEVDRKEYNKSLQALQRNERYDWDELFIQKLEELRRKRLEEVNFKLQRLIEQQHEIQKVALGAYWIDDYLKNTKPLLEPINPKDKEDKLLCLQVKRVNRNLAASFLVRMYNLIQVREEKFVFRDESLQQAHQYLLNFWKYLSKEQQSNYLSQVHHLKKISRRSLTLKTWFDGVFPSLMQDLEQPLQQNEEAYSQKIVPFETLQPLPRAEYFLSSAYPSTFVKHNLIDKYIKNLEQYLSSHALPLFSQQFQGITDPISPWADKSYLEHPKQYRDQKILLNSMLVTYKFLQDIEGLKTQDFQSGVSALVKQKIPLIISYLGAQNHAIYAQYNYTFEHIKIFKERLEGILTSVKTPVVAYGLETSMLENVLHYFLHGDLFLDAKPCTASLKAETQSIYSQIQKILSASNSYAKLLLNIGSIYSVSKKIKLQASKLPARIFAKHQQNLSHLKSGLWLELILAVDDLELALGINPERCSGELLKLIDELYENYLVGLNLGMVAFTKLNTDTAIETKCLSDYREKTGKSLENTKKYTSQIQQIKTFLASAQGGIQSLEQDFKTILPWIEAYHNLIPVVSSSQMLTTKVVKEDELFQSWRGEGATKIPNYLNRIQDTCYALQGLIKSEELHRQLLVSKQEMMNKRIQDKKDAKHAKDYLQRYYDNLSKSIVEQHLQYFPNLKEEFQSCLQRYLLERRENVLKRIDPKFMDDLASDREFCFGYDDVHGFVNSEMKQHIQNFKETQIEYLALESILTNIEKFEGYLNSRQDNDNFENEVTLGIKKDILAHLKNIALDSGLASKERLIVIREIMLKYSEALLSSKNSTNHFYSFFLAFYQSILEILAYLGIITLDYAQTKTLVQELKSPEVEKMVVLKLHDFHLFNNLNAKTCDADLDMSSTRALALA